MIWLLLFAVIVGWFGWWWRPRGRWPRGRYARYDEPRDLETLLAERFARGEINEEEYRGRLRVLRSELERDEDFCR